MKKLYSYHSKIKFNDLGCEHEEHSVSKIIKIIKEQGKPGDKFEIVTYVNDIRYGNKGMPAYTGVYLEIKARKLSIVSENPIAQLESSVQGSALALANAVLLRYNDRHKHLWNKTA